jgi:hypothetical protein
MYFSFDNILIRPYIPPTLSHPPFANANQRIYMSATLGEGGELERITGIRKIKRIPKPMTFKKRGYGKRLFIFPEYSLNEKEIISWLVNRISEENRTLILCPNKHLVNIFENIVNTTLPSYNILNSFTIEEDLSEFIDSSNNILILANRYDGLDIPGEKCKSTIIYGLPTGTNLQEQFLEDRLGLEVLLKERIKTRIQQASGRCTRNDNDRSVIIMLDRRMLDFCAKKENRDIFHPQIRAEMGLFFDVDARSKEILDAMIESFLNEDEYWNTAEETIAEIRDEEIDIESSTIEKLNNVVKDEVDFCYDLWHGDYENALRTGNRVVDNLSGEELSQYRALWYYFVSNPAIILSEFQKGFDSIARDYLIRAKSAGNTVSWFHHAIRKMLPDSEAYNEEDEISAIAVEGIIKELNSLGTVGEKFYNSLDKIESDLQETDYTKFDNALIQLGRLLGFSSFKPSGKAVPDAVWHIENYIGLIFEAKSGEDPEDGISVDNCTQAKRHLDWALSNKRTKNIDKKHSILVTPKTKIDEEAIKYSKDVNYVHTSEIFEIFEKLKKTLVTLRALLTSEIDQNFRNKILEEQIRNEITPNDITNLLTARKASELPIF